MALFDDTMQRCLLQWLFLTHYTLVMAAARFVQQLALTGLQMLAYMYALFLSTVRCHCSIACIARCNYADVATHLQGCRGPVHAQFVENWVTYHYWDVSNHRWEMSVLEMYNKAQGNVTITDMILGRSNGTTSSFQPVPLEVRLNNRILVPSSKLYFALLALPHVVCMAAALV